MSRERKLNDAIGRVLDRWWQAAKPGDHGIVYEDPEGCLDDIWGILAGFYRVPDREPRRLDLAAERERMAALRVAIDNLMRNE